MIKKVLFGFVVFSFCSVFTFFNLGKIVDATSKPKKVDLLVCLGGGSYKDRVAKTKELYNDGFLVGNTIIFTNHVKIDDMSKINIIQPKGLKNTYEEVVFVKKYMKEHSLKTATFITEAPHSFRILFFTKLFGEEGDFEFSVVGSKFDWDASSWYKYPHMRAYVFSEVTKLFYNLFLYGFLDNIGLKDWFLETFWDDISYGKRVISKGIL